jgi:pSer/pThr/pTyr-binding forkhead associated (FHA) protein
VLTKERTVIGRRKQSDISISDNSVSGLHASIARRGDKYEIVDMQSTNGVHIAGRRIDRQLLKDGDLVVVGEHQLEYLEGNFEGQVEGGNRDPVGLPPDVTADPGRLLVLSGKNKGEAIELSAALISVGEPGVQMAAISQRPTGHFIVHVDGGKDRNRVPMVNGEPIGFRSRKLEHGDTLEVAGIEMQYFVSDRTVINLR